MDKSDEWSEADFLFLQGLKTEKEEKGYSEGFAEGYKEGLLEGLREGLISVIELRFPAIAEEDEIHLIESPLGRGTRVYAEIPCA